jgi:peptide/nickel transport system permease protein
MSGRLVLVRVSHAVSSLLLLTVLIFVATRLTGDPTNVLLPDTATPEDFARVRAQLGLDQPLVVQYFTFLGDLAHGDLGDSFTFRTPVVKLIAARAPYTVALGLSALALVLLIGIPLGIYAAYWRGGAVDGLARGVAIVGQAAPPFWVGLILIWIVAVQLRWLPAGGYAGPANLIMPAITVAAGAMAGLTRLLRSSTIEVLDTDYVKFLRLQGESERSILWKHGLRNAGLTALTFTGILMASLLTGSVVVEAVFGWPGLGQLMAQSIESRDFPVIQAVVIVFALIYIIVNLLVDLLAAVVNPRLR